MNDGSLDEETPLLNSNTQKQRLPTPLPKLQIAIVLLLQVCEPLTSQSIYPYINQVGSCVVNRSGSIFRSSLVLLGQLISELDITGGDERRVGYYAGLIVESRWRQSNHLYPLISFFLARNLYFSLPRLLLYFNGVELPTISVESQLFSSVYLEQRYPCSLLVSLVLFGL